VLLHSGSFNILVDTGGNTYSSGVISKNTLIPLFKSLGITKIDYLFLSHGDYDHLGESYHLVNNFKVSKVYFNEGELNDNEDKLINLLKHKNINYSISYEGDFYKIGDYSLYSLGTNLNDENDSSMVLYGLINKNSFLLMGDASIKSEDVLLSKYNISNIDILKVGHHGSKTSSSSSFINKFNPKYSLISVGKDNKFKHPNKEVLDNLNSSKVYRTDKDGSIMILFYKDKFKVKTNKK
jgi:competence protein ComEC